MSNNSIPAEHRVETTARLEEIYGQVVPRAFDKELDRLSDHYRAFIEKSPFALLASVGPEGLDCSPRGDPPGFVRVRDERTVLMPDRRGNNRIDSLRNIVRDPRVSLLFLVPGVGETLRINGRAALSTEPELCASFEISAKRPRCVLVVSIESVYYQCQKALVRSKLWSDEARVERSELPTAGEMLQALSGGEFDGESYDRGYPEHMKKTIY
jgi:hypothetical protein